MANIEERKTIDGSSTYRVAIRRKGQMIYQSFKDKETAELFAYIKEKAIDEMEAFQVPDDQLVTIYDVISMKIEDYRKKDSSSSLRHAETSLNLFISYGMKDVEIADLNHEKLKKLVDLLIDTKIKLGGNKLKEDSTGKIKNMSFNTIRRHLAILSSSISYAQSVGFNIPNPVLEFNGFFRENYKD